MAATTVPWWIAAREAFALSIGHALRSPRYRIAAALLLLPSLFGYERLLESYFGLRLLPLAALVVASALVAEERERGTLVFLLTRPIARWALLTGKCAASCAIMTIPTLLAMALCGLGATNDFSAFMTRLPRDFGVALLALISYGALSVLLGVTTKRPIVWGLLFLFVWEQIALLPGAFHRLTFIAYLRQLLGSKATASATGATGHPLIVLLAASMAAILAAAWAFSRREYVSDPGHGAE